MQIFIKKKITRFVTIIYYRKINYHVSLFYKATLKVDNQSARCDVIIRSSTIIISYFSSFFFCGSRGRCEYARQTRDACVRFKTECDQYAYAYSVRTIVTCAMRDANAFFIVIANLSRGYDGLYFYSKR